MQDPIAKLVGEWLSNVTIYSVIIRLFLSLIMGGLMGYERARRGHTAGLRTYILIAISSTIAALIDSLIGYNIYVISCASIIAIALIGTNSITMSSKNRVKGLTTTVGLFSTAILGISFGAGSYTIGLIGTALVSICLSLLGKLETILKEKSSHMLIHLELVKSEYLVNFTTTIRKLGMTISDIEVNKAYINTSLAVYTISIELNNKNVLMYKKHKDIIDALMSLEYIVYLEELM